MVFQKINPPSKYPPYESKDDKKWDNINQKKERSMIKMNASNVAGQLLAAEIQVGLFKPADYNELLEKFTRLQTDIVTFLDMQ